MKKITESTLSSLSKRLKEYIAEADPAPAAAPAAAPAGPANAKEQNYATALKQIKDLYAKAQVQYPPQDEIVRQRYGLPPALPPIDQWDGKMPEAGQADFLTRNLFGRQASKDVAAAQKVNSLSNAGNAKADAAVAADMEKLKTLVAQLKSMAGGAGVAAQAAPAADLNAPRLNTAQVADAAAKGMAAATAPVAGGNGTWSAESINETMSRLMNTVRLLEAEAAPAPAAGGDKAAIIKQIQDIMADINAQNENPPQDVIAALQDAQSAIDAANKPTGSAALDGTKPGADPATTIPGGPGTAAGGAGVVPAGGVAAQKDPANQTKATAQRTGVNLTNKAGAQARQNFAKTDPRRVDQAAAPAAPAAPAQKGSMWNPMNWFKEGEMTEQEMVKYKDDQTLARIVDLTRR